MVEIIVKKIKFNRKSNVPECSFVLGSVVESSAKAVTGIITDLPHGVEEMDHVSWAEIEDEPVQVS